MVLKGFLVGDFSKSVEVVSEGSMSNRYQTEHFCHTSGRHGSVPHTVLGELHKTAYENF